MNTPEEKSHLEKPNFSQEEIDSIRELGVKIINGNKYVVLNPGHLDELKKIIKVDYPVIEVSKTGGRNLGLIQFDQLHKFLNGLIRVDEKGISDYRVFDKVISEVFLPEFRQTSLRTIKENAKFFKDKNLDTLQDKIRSLELNYQTILSLKSVYEELIRNLQSNELKKAPSLLINTIKENFIE